MKVTSIDINDRDLNSSIFSSVPSVNVNELSILHFQQNFRMIRPLIIKELASDWSSISLWTSHNYILSKIPDIDHDVLLANDGKNFLKHEYCDIITSNLHNIIENIMRPTENTLKYCRLYLNQVPLLHVDLSMSFLQELSYHESENTRIFVDKNCGIWISSSGCVTPLHYDLCHGFLTQIYGRKRFLLASPDDTLYLYRNQSPFTKNQTSSEVDLTKWFLGDINERKRFPKIDEVTWYIADLYPGDTLYTPPGWWHYVVSIDTSISLLTPFDIVPPEQLYPLQCI